MWKASLPGNSFSTLAIASGTAIGEKKPVGTAGLAVNNARISNDRLYFTLPAGAGARDLLVTLRDLQGRAVWSGHRGGSALLGEQQSFALHRSKADFLSGTYLLTVRIENSAGVVTTVEDKVKVLQ